MVAVKRVQDLERQVYHTNTLHNYTNLSPFYFMSRVLSLPQVKELERILKSRNPNSLPALIYAAANADKQDVAGAAKTSPPSSINAILERRIQHLEAELESHEEEAKRTLRAMEQQFQRIKVQCMP